ncbi:MAG: sigma-54-dependent Fis family transcriptional regulator [Planctomycetes bacterium]|nr:sigma-54-dependent Fis family transcriptional regulator [Planctomycetota bacterium]
MEQQAGKLLIVDDEKSLRTTLSIILKKEGYETQVAADGNEALAIFRNDGADVVLADLNMPNMDGITLLKELKNIDPHLMVIIMTAFSTWDSAVTAMRLGAYDYLKKPFDNENMKAIVGRAISQTRLLRSKKNARAGERPPISMVVGNTARMQEICDTVRRIAPTDSTVLIQGESGTGKELIAKLVHFSSLRAHHNFIAVSCGAFPESLLESELFGHVKGAFTSAIADKKGLLEVADGGTFFLDEVGELSAQIQVKLLRVLEEREFKPVGSTITKKVDVRFITATNRNLEEEVEKGNFREDLFFRLNVIPITLPPLKDRKQDIPLLAGHFLARYGKAMNKEITSIAPETMQALLVHDWPGNIRELENTIQRAVALARSDTILLEDLPPKLQVTREPDAWQLRDIPPQGINLDEEVGKIEKHFVRSALEKANWNMTKAAELLGLTFRSIRYKVEKYEITRPGTSDGDDA